MQPMFLRIFAIALLICSAAYAQSLGDVARENREKKTEDGSAAQAKVITNADLPGDPEANQGQREARSDASSQAPDQRSSEQRLREQRAADRWKRLILAQENKMATLQARIDQINAAIHSAGGTVQYEGPYNRYQSRQLERVAQFQQRLDEQRRKLDQMQDAARHAGMHTAVYDP